MKTLNDRINAAADEIKGERAAAEKERLRIAAMRYAAAKSRVAMYAAEWLELGQAIADGTVKVSDPTVDECEETGDIVTFCVLIRELPASADILVQIAEPGYYCAEDDEYIFVPFEDSLVKYSQGITFNGGQKVYTDKNIARQEFDRILGRYFISQSEDIPF